MKTHTTNYANAFIEVAVESQEYARLKADKSLKQLKALRSKR